MPGPLAARWTLRDLPSVRAGTLVRAQVEVENSGTATWRAGGVNAASHWLDGRGNPIGKHGAGPYWQALDGSRTLGTAKARADAPNADAIPWLLLAARPDGAKGSFSAITSIQRVNTVGGKAPASGCSRSNYGATARVAYSADYHFYGSR